MKSFAKKLQQYTMLINLAVYYSPKKNSKIPFKNVKKTVA